MTHLMQLCFRLIVGDHGDGGPVVGLKALGESGSVVRARAAPTPLEKAVGHGVCRAVHTDHQARVSNLGIGRGHNTLRNSTQRGSGKTWDP